MLRTILLTMVMGFPVMLWSQTPGDLEGDPERGEERYQALQCWACHGYTGETGSGTRLNPPRMNQTAFIAYVHRPSGAKLGFGPGNSMPPYDVPEVTDQDLADIYAWLVSLPSYSPPAEEIPLLGDLLED